MLPQLTTLASQATLILIRTTTLQPTVYTVGLWVLGYLANFSVNLPTLAKTCQSIKQSLTGTLICAQIKIIRFQNTAQKNKAPGDGENDHLVFKSTTTCHKSCSVRVCFEKVHLHK